MVLMREMPIRAAAKILGEHDTRLWRVLLRYVDAARAKEDHSPGAPGGGWTRPAIAAAITTSAAAS